MASSHDSTIARLKAASVAWLHKCLGCCSILGGSVVCCQLCYLNLCLIWFVLQVPRKCIAEFSVNAQKTGTLQNADFVQARSCPEATSP